MTWNHRVVRHEGDDGPYFQIHGVYYDKDGEPNSITANAVAPFGESPEELKREIQLMLAACGKPVINYEDIA